MQRRGVHSNVQEVPVGITPYGLYFCYLFLTFSDIKNALKPSTAPRAPANAISKTTPANACRVTPPAETVYGRNLEAQVSFCFSTSFNWSEMRARNTSAKSN